jgi:hypothetical protein
MEEIDSDLEANVVIVGNDMKKYWIRDGMHSLLALYDVFALANARLFQISKLRILVYMLPSVKGRFLIPWSLLFGLNGVLATFVSLHSAIVAPAILHIFLNHIHRNRRLFQSISGACTIIGLILQVDNTIGRSSPFMRFTDLAIHVAMFGYSLSFMAVLGRQGVVEKYMDIGGNMGVVIVNFMGMMLTIVASIWRSSGIEIGWVGGRAMGLLQARG